MEKYEIPKHVIQKARNLKLERVFTKLGGDQFRFKRVHPKYAHLGMETLNTNKKETEKIFGEYIWHMPDIREHRVDGRKDYSSMVEAWKYNYITGYKPKAPNTLREIRTGFYIYNVIDDIYKIGIANPDNIAGRILWCYSKFIEILEPLEFSDIWLAKKRKGFDLIRPFLLWSSFDTWMRFEKEKVAHPICVDELRTKLKGVFVLSDAIAFESRIKKEYTRIKEKELAESFNIPIDRIKKMDGRTELFRLTTNQVSDIIFEAFINEDGDEITEAVLHKYNSRGKK